MRTRPCWRAGARRPLRPSASRGLRRRRRCRAPAAHPGRPCHPRAPRTRARALGSSTTSRRSAGTFARPRVRRAPTSDVSSENLTWKDRSVPSTLTSARASTMSALGVAASLMRRAASIGASTRGASRVHRRSHHDSGHRAPRGATRRRHHQPNQPRGWWAIADAAAYDPPQGGALDTHPIMSVKTGGRFTIRDLDLVVDEVDIGGACGTSR